ncbi:MAG: DUF6524 family protein [Pseudomonadota bacterium]
MLRALLIRCAAALVLVMVTFNPTGFSYTHWALSGGANLPLAILLGLVLLVAYVVFLRATFRSIGFIGIGLVVAVVGAFVWLLTDFGIINFQNPGVMAWIGLIVISLVLGLGLSWSIIRRAITGQLDVDDVEQ